MRPCRSPFVMTARSGHGSALPGVRMDGNVAVVLCLSGSRLAVRISGRAALSPEWSIPRVPSCIWLASPGCVAIGGRRALWPVCVSTGDRRRGNAYPIRHVRFMCDGACAAAKRVRGWLTVVLFDTDMMAMRRAADRDRAAGRASALCAPRFGRGRPCPPAGFRSFVRSN